MWHCRHNSRILVGRAALGGLDKVITDKPQHKETMVTQLELRTAQCQLWPIDMAATRPSTNIQCVAFLALRFTQAQRGTNQIIAADTPFVFRDWTVEV
jgi:hypothetical protein